MTETKFTPGPLEARVVHGWGDTFCIIAVGAKRPIANFIRPKSYYPEWVKEVDSNGDEYSILSERRAKEAGNYVPTKEHKQAIDAEQLATAHLFAAAPELYEACEEPERRLRQCAKNIRDEFPFWARDLEKMADQLATTLAKARGEA